MRNKNLLRKLFIAFSVIILSFFLGCRDDAPKEEPPQPKPDNTAIKVSEKTKVISTKEWDKADATYNEKDKKITVKNASAIQSIKESDIVVSDKDGGYLRKVTKVSSQGQEIVLSTEDATLEDAFDNLDLTMSLPIERQTGNFSRSNNYSNSVYYEAEPLGDGSGRYVAVAKNRINPYGKGKTKPDKAFTQKFELALDKAKKVKVKGELKIEPTMKGEVKISWGRLKKLDLGFEIAQDLSLEITSKAELEHEIEKKLADVKFKDMIVVAGGVPIVIRPEVSFTVGLRAKMAGEVTAKLEQGFTYTAGVRYENGSWNQYADKEFDYELPLPKVKGEASLEAYIRPKLKLRFYRVVAPNIGVEVGAKGEVSASAQVINGFDYDWSFKGYLNAGVGVEATIFGKNILDKYVKGIIEIDYPIASAKDYKGNRPPSTPTLLEPKRNFITDKHTVTFKWSASDPDGDPLEYDVYYGAKGKTLNLVAKRITETSFALPQSLIYGEYAWKVVAREKLSKEIKEPKETESPVQYFTIIPPNHAPTAPVLTAPANNIKLTTGKNIKLEWKASTDEDKNAVTYNIFITDKNGTEPALVENNYTKTTYTIPQTLQEGTYKWKITATDGKANTDSQIFTFSVKAPATPAITLSTNNVSVNAGSTATVEVTAGSGNYKVSSNKTNIATATLSGNTITLTGKARGTAIITVTDTQTGKTAQIAVTVTQAGNVEVPDGVVIENGVLKKWPCDKIPADGHVSIPNSVTSIGKEAFYRCRSLISVNIPNSVTSIEYKAFSFCSSLTSVSIGNSVTSIGAGAFGVCENLISVNIPNSVTSIRNSAFWGCRSLTSIVIPNSVTSIEGNAFSECSSLKSIVIPNSVTSINYNTFYGCRSLTSIVIPNSVTSIGDNAFSFCRSLTSVSIPDSVTSIGVGAFSSCDNLTSVNIPNSVTSIGGGVFSFSYNLISVSIGNSVTSIGSNAFHGCSSLISVTCKSVAPPVVSLTHGTLGYAGKLIVPKGSKAKYEKAEGWKECNPIVEE